MELDRHRLCVELRRLEWAEHLDEQVIEDIAGAARWMEFVPGQVIIDFDSEADHVYFVVAGRLDGLLFDRLGKEIHRDNFRRGAVAGLFSVLLPERSHLRVEAVEPTTVIHLGLDDLLRLTAKHRDFQLAIFRAAANLVKRLMLVDRELPKPAVVGVVHHSDASRPLTGQLIRRLHELGEVPCVAGDDERWKAGDRIPYQQLFEHGVFVGPEKIKQILTEWTSYGRLFLDFAADHSTDELDRMIRYSDVVLWCVRPQDAASTVERLKAARRAALVRKGLPRLALRARRAGPAVCRGT